MKIEYRLTVKLHETDVIMNELENGSTKNDLKMPPYITGIYLNRYLVVYKERDSLIEEVHFFLQFEVLATLLTDVHL